MNRKEKIGSNDFDIFKILHLIISLQQTIAYLDYQVDLVLFCVLCFGVQHYIFLALIPI